MCKDNYLLSSVTHDLKNYMAVIEAVVFNLRESELTEDQKYSINLIEHSKDSMLALLNNTLNWAKFKSEKLVLNQECFRFYNMVKNTINMFEFNAVQKNVDLSYEINMEVPLIVYGDEIRFKQILINLISNSLKFTAYGDIKAKFSLLEDSTSENVHIQCIVTDTGKGMTEEEMETIFDLFKSNDPVNGTGIGLTITKELVELMGGKINVESSDKGTTFTFDIYFKLDN